MKYICRLLLFSLTTLAGLAPLNAQWERIGWEGGTVNITAQLGNTLYGTANYSFYKSTDWGMTWKLFHDGLILDTLIFGSPGYPLYYTLHDNYLFLEPYIWYDNLPGIDFGIYYFKEKDTKWSFKKLTRVASVPHIMPWSQDTLISYHGGDFYFSQDGGNAWELRMNGLSSYRQRGEVFSVKSHFFHNETTQLKRSDDFGQTWKSVNVPTSEFWGLQDGLYRDTEIYTGDVHTIQDSIILQYYRFDVNSNTFITGLFRSSDFGMTWVNISNLNNTLPNRLWDNIQQIKSVGKKTFMITDAPSGAYNRNNGFVSDDFGEHWKRITTLDTNLWVLDVFGKDNFYIIKTTTGSLTTDSTFATFIPLISNEKGIFEKERVLVGVHGSTLFAFKDTVKYIFRDSLMVSRDNGMTWSQEVFFDNNKLDDHRWIVDAKKLYASGIQKDFLPCIFQTTDEGITWMITTTISTKDSIRRFFVTGDTIIVIRANDFLFSIDKGLSWIVTKSPEISDSVNMTYRNKKIVLLNLQSGIITSSLDLINWVTDNRFSLKPDIVFGPYIFGERWFIFAEKRGYIPYQLFYRTKEDPSLQKSNGLPLSKLCMPSCDENGILYATEFNIGDLWTDEGRTALYYSLDSGANWKQLGDYVTNSPDVFIGSDYIFLAGPTELWRGPKPTIPSGVSHAKTTSSISINECYPNPAASELRISYSIPKHSDVVLSIFDMTEKKLSVIANEAHEGGSYEKLWNVKSLPSGSYILKLTACGESVTKVVEVVR